MHRSNSLCIRLKFPLKFPLKFLHSVKVQSDDNFFLTFAIVPIFLHVILDNPEKLYPKEQEQRETITQSAFSCSKLTIETLGQGVKYVQSFFIVNFEHISYLVLVFLLLTLNR